MTPSRLSVRRQLRQQSAETSKAAVGGSLPAGTEVIRDLRQHPSEVSRGLLVRDAEPGGQVADRTRQGLADLAGADGLVRPLVDPGLATRPNLRARSPKARLQSPGLALQHLQHGAHDVTPGSGRPARAQEAASKLIQ